MANVQARRVACIQHGDYRESLRIIGSGQVEPYFGMAYTIEVLDRLLADAPGLVISLDAPSYRERRGATELVGVPTPRLPRRVPLRVAEHIQSWRIGRLLRSFRPTHVLLRTAKPIVGLDILRHCRRRRCSTLVVLANVMSCDHPRVAAQVRPMIDLLNRDFVFRVGNHKAPATRSLVECGLHPDKAIAWDWPAQRRAVDFEPKELPPPPFRLVYAGSTDYSKGVGTLIDAATVLHGAGFPFQVSILGGGNDLDALRDHARAALPEGIVRFEGRVPNGEVFRFMREATLVVVPSRHDFPEGMPLTLTEGLASRTPIVASDHPVLVRGFRDGEGVRFFTAADPHALADLVRAIAGDPAAYRSLSESTAQALDRVTCPTTFGDLVEQWDRAPMPAHA